MQPNRAIVANLLPSMCGVAQNLFGTPEKKNRSFHHTLKQRMQLDEFLELLVHRHRAKLFSFIMQLIA